MSDAHTRSSEKTIFVLIASYRDPECQHTVRDLFEKAAHADRIHVGICWQYDPDEDAHCFEVSTRPDQVSINPYHWKESKGLGWARHEAQQLYDGEDYMLCIDSHMRFIPGWDEELMAQLDQCDSDKPILSAYPAQYTPPDNLHPDAKPSCLRAKFFNKQGEIRFNGFYLSREPDRPLNGAFIAGGFVFASARLLQEVPYDPYIAFGHEEVMLVIRYYTHGWDVFSPTKNILYHYYVSVDPKDAKKRGRPLYWEDHDARDLATIGLMRYFHLTGYRETDEAEVLREIDTYGLGTARSLDDYIAYCGIDFRRHKLNEAKALRCGFIKGLEQWLKRVHVPELDEEDKRDPFYLNQLEAPSAHVSPAPAIVSAAHTPKKIWEGPQGIVYDDFLPDELFQDIWTYLRQSDYEHINTKGRISRAWHINDGFPLRTLLNLFYYPDEATKPDADYVYPTGTAFDRFAEQMMELVPQVKGLVGEPVKDWANFSVTGWIYPQGTGLSMHDDGSGIYSGAYAYFVNPDWKIHWGGLLLFLHEEANRRIQAYKETVDPVAYYKEKWLDQSLEYSMIWDPGLATCIFPRPNRLVFIKNDAYHMVTKVNRDAGDNLRMSLAGFFHKART